MPPIAPTAGGVRVERLVTSGTFELDGGSWEVDNNVWIVGDDRECVVIDPSHDARRIVKSIPRERTVTAVLLTHAHNDHINGVGRGLRRDPRPGIPPPGGPGAVGPALPGDPGPRCSPMAMSSRWATSTCT